MKKFTRPVITLAVSAGLVLSGTAAAQAATPASSPAPAVATVGFGSLCEATKTLHWTAEWVLDALGLQPIFGLIDKPIIHPILWSPLNLVTGGCGVDSHPPGLS